jgi:DNA-binding SARP family transcriptional activator
MLFRVLGPVEIRTEVGWSPIRATQQRQVLAILLARTGSVVTADRLIAELWGHRRPSAALATIRVYVMHLRRMLGDEAAHLLETRNGGYRLAVGEGDLDAGRFERLARAGQHSLADGDLPAAAATLGRALALWRGPAMADLLSTDTPTVAAEAARLEQRRLSTVDGYFDAQLGLGRHADVVDELFDTLGRHPLHERLREQLMLALYRCGRRGEALDAYHQGRRLLMTELGLEPGRGLRDLHAAILADEGLRVTSSAGMM